MGAHLRKLEDSGYISCKREFVGRRPRTTYSLTAIGRRALKQYVETMQQIIDLASGDAAPLSRVEAMTGHLARAPQSSACRQAIAAERIGVCEGFVLSASPLRRFLPRLRRVFFARAAVPSACFRSWRPYRSGRLTPALAADTISVRTCTSWSGVFLGWGL